MTTVADILNQALTDAGVIGAGETPSAEDSTTALTKLNQMLAQWQVNNMGPTATYSALTIGANVPWAAEFDMPVQLSLAELLSTAYGSSRPDLSRDAAKARRILKRNKVTITNLVLPVLTGSRVYTGG